MRITLLMNSAPSCTHHNTTLRSPLSSINSLGCESYFTNTTTCVVGLSDAEWSNGLILEDNRPAVPGYKGKKGDEMLGGTRLVLEHFGLHTAKRRPKAGP